MAGSSRADYRFGQQIPDPPEFRAGGYGRTVSVNNLHYALALRRGFALADSGGWQRWFFAGIAARGSA